MDSTMPETTSLPDVIPSANTTASPTIAHADVDAAAVPGSGSGSGIEGWRSVVVRVKRRRSEGAGEEVIVLEGSAERDSQQDGEAPRKKRVGASSSLQGHFADMSTAAAGESTGSSSSRRLYLRRVQTIEAGGSGGRKRTAEEVDGDTLGTFRQYAQIHSQASGQGQPLSSTAIASNEVLTNPATSSSSGRWVPEGKKRLRLVSGAGADESIVVVDMQVRSSAAAKALSLKEKERQHSIAIATAETDKAPSNCGQKPKGFRILDPCSRRLQTAIEGAMQVMGGDASSALSECLAAVEQGADVNLQTQRHGLTVLMAGAYHGDTRMVSHLLAKGADASLRTHISEAGSIGNSGSHELKKAFDFAEDPDSFGPHSAAKPSALREIMMLLRMAERGGKANKAQAPAAARVSMEAAGDEDEAGFVVDVYCVMEQVDDDMSGNAAGVPRVVTVPGLRFNVDKTSGNILDIDFEETTFAYDSDWSDLGDDEDPDSNDERFFGNDYPEEEDEESVGGSDDDSSGCGRVPLPPGGHRPVRREVRAGPKGHAGGLADENWEDVSSSDDGDGYPLYACEDFDFELDGSDGGDEGMNGSGGNGRRVDDQGVTDENRRVRFQAPEREGVHASTINDEQAVGMDVEGEGSAVKDSGQLYNKAEWTRMQLLSQQAQKMSALPSLKQRATGRGSDQIDYLNQVGGRDDSRALRAAGRVLAPFTREDPFQPVSKKKGALTKLWDGASAAGAGVHPEAMPASDGPGDEDIALLRGLENSNSEASKHLERLRQMDERLGLVEFESNANEFDANGLPKYGAELSDDETDLQYLRSAYTADITWTGDGKVIIPGTNNNTKSAIEQAALTHNNIAYDSELDNSSDGGI